MTSFGKYDQRVKFKNFQNVPDGAGGTEPVWTEKLSTPARMIQVGSRRDIEQMQIGLPKTYRIAILKRKAYTPSELDTVEYEGNDFTITGINEGKELRMGQEWVIDIVGK